MVYISGGTCFFTMCRAGTVAPCFPRHFPGSGRPQRGPGRLFVWEEARGPTSSSSTPRNPRETQDLDEKYQLYQDTLRIPEYFLFDPKQEYLTAPGFRLSLRSDTHPSSRSRAACPAKCWGSPRARRCLPASHDSATGQRLLTSWESLSVTEAALRKAEAEKRQAEAERLVLAEARAGETGAICAVEAERELMQRELEALRRKLEAAG